MKIVARRAINRDGAICRTSMHIVHAVEPGCIMAIRGSDAHDGQFVSLQMTSAIATDEQGRVRKVNIGYIR